MRILKTTLMLVLAVQMAGCGTMNQVNRETKAAFEKHQKTATEALAARPSATLRTSGGHIVSDIPYVNIAPIHHETVLPPSFSRSMTMNEPHGVSVQTLMRKINAASGLRVVYESDLTGAAQDRSAASTQLNSGKNEVNVANMPPLPMAHATQLGGVISPESHTGVAINYTGDVKGLLDVLATSLGAQWKWDADHQRVKIYRNVTETFTVSMVPGTMKTMASVGTDTSGGGGSIGGAQAETTFENDKLSVWTALHDALGKIVSQSGSFSINEAMGTVTVRDRWDRVEQVKEYIDQLNTSLARQVEIDVRVYSVVNSQGDTRGVNWNLMYQQLSKNYNVNLITNRPDTTGQGVSSAIIGVPTGSGSPWAGSNAFIDAISLIGKTSMVTSGSVQTVNHQPSPLKFVRKIKYLASATPMYVAGSPGTSPVGAGAQLTPGEIEVGFKVMLVPHIEQDGQRILLQVLGSLTALDDMLEKTSGGNTIQLPQVSAREFMQRAWLKGGESLVLTGFEHEEASNTIGAPFSGGWWLAGTRKNNDSKASLVVVITPAVSASRSTM